MSRYNDSVSRKYKSSKIMAEQDQVGGIKTTSSVLLSLFIFIILFVIQAMHFMISSNKQWRLQTDVERNLALATHNARKELTKESDIDAVKMTTDVKDIRKQL